METVVLLANEYPVVRDGLRTLISGTDDLILGGEAADGQAALDMVRQSDWGLLLLDLSMRGRSGLELLKLIRTERPRLPILVLSAQREELYALRAIRAGAMGYLSLRADTDTLLAAMRRVAAGRMFVSSEVTELLANQPASGAMLPHDRLTDREYSIFSRIVSGATLTDIADELSLSIKTISTHKSHILDKMTLAGQVELVRYAIEHKLLDTVSE